MKTGGVALVAAAALLCAPAAVGAPAPDLDAAASFAAGRPVTVECVQLAAGIGGEVDHANRDVIRLANHTCAWLRARLARRNVRPEYLAVALRILAHEAQHTKGVLDESVAECDALRVLPSLAARHFGYRLRTRPLRDLVDLAWWSHRALPADYRRLC